MNKRQELYRSLLVKKKMRGLEDLYYFNKHIIETEADRKALIVPHVHGEWLKWYNGSKKRIKMLLVPRGTFKSTFITVGRSLQAIAANRDTRILLANATLGNSQKFLGEIKTHLRKNRQFIELYGEEGFYHKDLKWNESEIEVLGRGLNVREPTITAAGVGGNLVSQHYNLIICDDLVNLENSMNRFQANKVIDWWRRAFSLLDYDGEMIVVGTRWAYFELYSWILKKMGNKADSYIRGAYKEDGSYYFPELLDGPKLDELRALQGSYVFSSFYLNDPVDEESALIKRSQLKYWGPGEEIETLPRELGIFALCDPAVSQETFADESSIIIVGVDWENNWYVLEVRSGKWTVGQLIEELFAVHAQWKPQSMSIEVIGQAQGLLTPIHEEENRRNRYLPLVEIKCRGRITKTIRIRSVLQPRFERGKIFIKRDMIELEDQILKFPRSSRDDIIDALTDMEDISFAPDEPEPSAEEIPSSHLEALLKRQAARKEPNTDPTMGENF